MDCDDEEETWAISLIVMLPQTRRLADCLDQQKGPLRTAYQEGRYAHVLASQIVMGQAVGQYLDTVHLADLSAEDRDDAEYVLMMFGLMMQVYGLGHWPSIKTRKEHR